MILCFGACLNLAKCQWASSPSVSGSDCDGLYRWCTGCSLWMWWWFCWSSQREDRRSVEIRTLFVSWCTAPLSRTCSLLDGWMNLPLSRAMLWTAWLSAWSCLLSMPPEPSTTSSLPVRHPHTQEYSKDTGLQTKSLKLLFSLCSVKLEPRRCWKVKSQKVKFVFVIFPVVRLKNKSHSLALCESHRYYISWKKAETLSQDHKTWRKWPSVSRSDPTLTEIHYDNSHSW